MMTKHDKRLVSMLLDMASDEFSTNGCGDLPIPLFDGMSEKEKNDLCKSCNVESVDQIEDWNLMGHYKRKILE